MAIAYFTFYLGQEHVEVKPRHIREAFPKRQPEAAGSYQGTSALSMWRVLADPGRGREAQRACGHRPGRDAGRVRDTSPSPSSQAPIFQKYGNEKKKSEKRARLSSHPAGLGGSGVASRAQLRAAR